MTTATKTTLPPDHVHFHNHHTGRPRFHFDENAGGGQQQQNNQQQQAPTWHEGVPPEIKGFWENKGLPLDNPKDFGLKLTEIYKAAEKFIGVPPDQVVRLPKADAPPEDLRAFYERLGAPKEAKDYDFSAIKDSQGQPIAAPLADTLRASAHAAGLSKDAALAIARDVAKHIDSQATERTNIAAAKQETDRAELKKNWGDKFEFNRLQAMEGARKLGIPPEGVAGLESVMGYSKTMEALRKIGMNTREDTFIERGADGSFGQVTTVAGAEERKAELMKDPLWAERFLKGGAAEVAEMNRLNHMIAGAAA